LANHSAIFSSLLVDSYDIVLLACCRTAKNIAAGKLRWKVFVGSGNTYRVGYW